MYLFSWSFIFVLAYPNKEFWCVRLYIQCIKSVGCICITQCAVFSSIPFVMCRIYICMHVWWCELRYFNLRDGIFLWLIVLCDTQYSGCNCYPVNATCFCHLRLVVQLQCYCYVGWFIFWCERKLLHMHCF